jgi:phosphatidylglycerophosphatase A
VVVLSAFVAFRLFDILKPPPIRRLEELPHGWGVLMDDLLAGVYANVAAQLLARIVIP